MSPADSKKSKTAERISRPAKTKTTAAKKAAAAKRAKTTSTARGSKVSAETKKAVARRLGDDVQRIDAEQRRVMIQEAAYYIAETRGFSPGAELDDWIAAERLIDDLIVGGEARQS